MEIEDFNEYFTDVNNDDSTELRTSISDKYIQTISPNQINFEDNSS